LFVSPRQIKDLQNRGEVLVRQGWGPDSDEKEVAVTVGENLGTIVKEHVGHFGQVRLITQDAILESAWPKRTLYIGGGLEEPFANLEVHSGDIVLIIGEY
jgi:hypothetical protein